MDSILKNVDSRFVIGNSVKAILIGNFGGSEQPVWIKLLSLEVSNGDELDFDLGDETNCVCLDTYSIQFRSKVTPIYSQCIS